MNSFKIILKGTLTKPLTPVFEGKKNKAVGESNVEKRKQIVTNSILIYQHSVHDYNYPLFLPILAQFLLNRKAFFCICESGSSLTLALNWKGDYNNPFLFPTVN